MVNEQELVETSVKESDLHGSGPLRRTVFLVEKYVDGPSSMPTSFSKTAKASSLK